MSSMTETAPAVATTYPYFTEEHDMFRETVRQFVQAEIAPHAEEWDEAGIFPRELFKKAANLGLFGIRLDPKYGGSGLDWWYRLHISKAFVGEQRRRGDGDVCSVGHYAAGADELGTDEQKEEFCGRRSRATG